MEKQNKKILIYDFGLCTSVAEKLAQQGNEVYYFCPWENAFPKSSLAVIGEGLDGVERVRDFWDWVDKVDQIHFYDTFCSDIEGFLRKKGYKVFGAGESEILENNRWKSREVQQAVGLPTQHTVLIEGIEDLIEFLKENKNKVIKLNTFRGDIETFKHKEYDTTEAQYLGELMLNLGAKGKKVEFIAEDFIEGVEPGYDGFCIDGEYPAWAMFGYERKGTGYIGKVARYDELPEPIRLVNEKLKPVFKKFSPIRSFFSTEIRVGKDKKPYLIDPCVRSPMPVPTAIHLEIWDNISDFLVNAAEGKMIELKPKAKYGAGICFESDWAGNHWTEIKFDEKYRDFIKLRMACKIDGRYYALPGFTSLGSVVGLGNTIQEAIDNVKKVADTLEVKELNYSISGLENIVKEDIPEGKKYGIEF